jgi:hypothetical protein
VAGVIGIYRDLKGTAAAHEPAHSEQAKGRPLR